MLCCTCATPRLRRAAVVRSTRVTRSSSTEREYKFKRSRTLDYITQAVDILWLGHMLCEQYYAPPEKPFEMTLKLLDIEKQEYGEKICDYYLKSLGLPEIGGKGLFAA